MYTSQGFEHGFARFRQVQIRLSLEQGDTVFFLQAFDMIADALLRYIGSFCRAANAQLFGGQKKNLKALFHRGFPSVGTTRHFRHKK